VGTLIDDDDDVKNDRFLIRDSNSDNNSPCPLIDCTLQPSSGDINRLMMMMMS
jgi:hypothetical protein